MNNKTIKLKYQNDLESLIKAYQLDDKEVLQSVKDYIYETNDLAIADNIESIAFQQSLDRMLGVK